MSFDLEITIAGLCLIVPETNSDGTPRSLHVLLPRTPTTGDHAHTGAIHFLKRHLDSSAGVVDPFTIDLENKEIDLSALTSATALNHSLSPQVYSFDRAFTPRSVDKKLIDWSSFDSTRLRARLRINTGAEEKARMLPGAIWMLENVPVQMATSVVWVMRDLPGDELDLPLAPKPLKALDEGGARPSIRLFLLHVPPDEQLTAIPGSLARPSWIPTPPFEAAHFHHHYQLVTPHDPMANPWYIGLPGTILLHQPSSMQVDNTLASSHFGSELTCMVATGSPG